MNKRKLKKSQRIPLSYRHKRRRSVRIMENKIKFIEKFITEHPDDPFVHKIFIELDERIRSRNAIIIQKYFRGYMIRKKN